jgi:hypothetical protein
MYVKRNIAPHFHCKMRNATKSVNTVGDACAVDASLMENSRRVDPEYLAIATKLSQEMDAAAVLMKNGLRVSPVIRKTLLVWERMVNIE